MSHGESPFGDYASSNIENSPDADTETERKGQETKLGHIRSFYTQQNEDDTAVAGKREGSQDLQLSHRSEDVTNGMHFQAPPQIGGSEGPISNDTPKESPKHQGNESTAIDQRKPKVSIINLMSDNFSFSFQSCSRI